jgi:hypothetical protein
MSSISILYPKSIVGSRNITGSKENSVGVSASAAIFFAQYLNKAHDKTRKDKFRSEFCYNNYGE